MNCNLCPRRCNVSRCDGELGFCGMPDEIYAARAALHFGEEPVISGTNGSGAIFFSGCNLRCAFCQNHEISTDNYGEKISVERLAEIFFELEEKNAHNINLVTPTHYSYKIAKAVAIARKRGLIIPIVYNCGGYESVNTIKFLYNTVDIYLPDFKYVSPHLSAKYSNAPDYFSTAKKALEQMVINRPKPIIQNGLMKYGVIVRHMVLPGCVDDSKRVLRYLYNEYKNDIYISIMSQYTPVNNRHDELCRSITLDEYNEVVDFAAELGIENAFVQDLDSSGTDFIPKFDLEGIFSENKFKLQ